MDVCVPLSCKLAMYDASCHEMNKAPMWEFGVSLLLVATNTYHSSSTTNKLNKWRSPSSSDMLSLPAEYI